MERVTKHTQKPVLEHNKQRWCIAIRKLYRFSEYNCKKNVTSLRYGNHHLCAIWCCVTDKIFHLLKVAHYENIRTKLMVHFQKFMFLVHLMLRNFICELSLMFELIFILFLSMFHFIHFFCLEWNALRIKSVIQIFTH